MSGSTIGGVVGAVVGAFVGSPQLGWMIGSAIGGYVDPDVIKGPRLHDAQIQTSQEGVPRPIVYGTVCVAGNIIQTGPLLEHSHKERTGKGGPVQKTYTYTRTYAIRICEGPISGIARIWRDDKLVYDARDPNTPQDGIEPNLWASVIRVMQGDSAAFASKLTIHLGDETQLPDATLEGLPAEYGGGAGNVPAYRGTAYVVIANDDLTDRGGAVPQYRFEVIDATATGGNTPAPFIGTQTHALTLTGYAASAYLSYSPTAGCYYWIDPANGIGVGTTIASGKLNDALVRSNGPGTLVFQGNNPDSDPDFISSRGVAVTVSASGQQALWSLGDDAGYLLLLASGECVADLRPTLSDPATWHFGEGSYSSQPEYAGLTWFNNAGYVYHGVRRTNDTTYNKIFKWPLSGATTPVPVVAAVATSPTVTSGSVFYMHMDRGYTLRALAMTEGQLITYDASLAETERRTLGIDLTSVLGLGVDSGVLFLITTTTLECYDLATLAHIKTVTFVGSMQINNHQLIASDNSLFIRSGEFVKRIEYRPSCMVGVPLGWHALPDQTGFVTNGTLTMPLCSISLAQVGHSTEVLSSVVADLCSRVGVTAAQVDVAALTDHVRGFFVGSQMSCSDAVRALQRGYFFDFPEWDLKLRGVKRGGAALFDLTDDDLVWSDEDVDTRQQAVEFPRKINLISPDPAKNYEGTKETAERRTDNIKAVGETTLELPISQTSDERAQTSEKMLKVAWTEAEGTWKRKLPAEFSQMTPSDPFTHGGKRWRAEKIEYGDGVVDVEATRDRVSAYDSHAIGDPYQPRVPPSSLRGPTIFAAVNLPALRSEDTTPGMYVGAMGLLAGWVGCDLQLSTDGGLTFSTVLRMTTAATIGSLTEACGTSGTITVNTPKNALESVTTAQLAAGANAFSVWSDPTQCEVGQFQTATETDTDTFALTSVTRPLLGTPNAAHPMGAGFLLLDETIYFLPLNIALAGKTLIFRPVTIGTAPENNPTYEVVFAPLFTGPAAMTFRAEEDGTIRQLEDGTYRQVE